jgi:diketogulonate reductase-like aldo/keto reductase
MYLVKNIKGIPPLGFGTWALRGDTGQEAIEYALEVGYRHLDTADWYKNHEIVGKAIKSSQIPRKDIYLATKVYPPYDRENVLESGKRFLEELNVEYIDLLLIHWPGNDPIEETLGAMQELKEEGLVKDIGVSNFDNRDLQKAINTGIEIKNNQIRINPSIYPKEQILFCKDNGITVTAYSPLGEGSSLKNREIKDLAKEHEVLPSQIILKWLLDKGLIVIPRSSKKKHILENWETQNLDFKVDLQQE